MAQRRKSNPPPIHPGELLREELQEIGVSLNELGRALRVPNEPDQRDREWKKGHHGGHSHASGSLLRHVAAVLAESSERLRSWKSQNRRSVRK